MDDDRKTKIALSLSQQQGMSRLAKQIILTIPVLYLP